MLTIKPILKKYAAGATLAIATVALSGCYYAPYGYGPRYAYAAPAYGDGYGYAPGYYAAPAYGYAPYGSSLSLSFGGGGYRHHGW